MNENVQRELVVLFADDDLDDRALLQDAFEETQLNVRLYFVADGEELINYLHREGKYRDAKTAPKPDIILLDLNMPRRDGWWALQHIKKDTGFSQIPLIIFTTSSEEEDVIRGYQLGASSFITKPASFEKLKRVVKKLEEYWFQTVELPKK